MQTPQSQKTNHPSGRNLAEDEEQKPSTLVRRGLIPDTRSQRILALATFVNMIGSGAFMVSAALFFTRVVGLPLTQVGLGMGIAAAVGLFAGVPVGHLADRQGPREIYMWMLAIQGAAMAALVFVQSFWLVLVALCMGELARSAGGAARGPLVRGIGGADLTRYRAYLRSVANLAGSCAAVAAGLAVQYDTRPAYLALVLGNALSFAASAAIIAALPSLPPVPAPQTASPWEALKDRAYVAVTVLDGIMSIHHQVLLFALPLWIVGHTDAPRWLIGGAALVNTALVVLLQVRASRGVDDSVTAGKAMRRSGWRSSSAWPRWPQRQDFPRGWRSQASSSASSSTRSVNFGTQPARWNSDSASLPPTPTGSTWDCSGSGPAWRTWSLPPYWHSSASPGESLVGSCSAECSSWRV
ncbi:MFS transporter [Micromonospora sp. NPDC049460]|uniref:MFS transporter n=1 Tax=Micromonospora sp. NPDC049460 TaxID=3364272 RepID=UPI0037A32EFE